MTKIRDTDYLFLSAYIHAGEKRLSEGRQDKAAVFDEMQKLAPDGRLVDFFRLKYDYHNAKVLLKSAALNKDESRLFLPLGRVRPEKLGEAFREQKFGELPPVFGAALLDAADTLSRTGDPRLADFILDKAYLEEMGRTAESAGSAFLAGYARLWADVYNLRSLMRMIKSGVSSDKLEHVLTDRGSVDIGKIKAAYPDVIPLYKGTELSAALPSAESTVAGESFSLFERVCSDVLDEYMRDARFQCFGEKVLIYYLYQVERAGYGL